jgi:hypothetical protein
MPAASAAENQAAGRPTRQKIEDLARRFGDLLFEGDERGCRDAAAEYPRRR